MQGYFPMAVWYGGGKTRATMIRHPEAGARDEWRRDLEQIKDCGFNAVKTWVDWAASEPCPGEYHYEAQDLIMDIAHELGLRVIVQLYLDSARLVSSFYPDSRYVSAGGMLLILKVRLDSATTIAASGRRQRPSCRTRLSM